ncbi:MAG: molecular chaperone [Limnohabitans sp.]|nr:molecular chaperone [Limnohabitans sp.]
MATPPITTALDEETARAELYGLFSVLFYATPTDDLLAQIRLAPTEAPAAGGFLEEPWRQLVGMARNMNDADIRAEHDSLFGGVGKPEVYLFSSHYIAGFLNEKPLIQLRNDIAALGLARNESMNETEDHISYLTEVMRFLIAGDDVAVSNLSQQSQFFAAHLQPWAMDLCDALTAHPRAKFYGALSKLLRDFLNVEAQAFDMLI